jgi:signal transduction histidine kinase
LPDLIAGARAAGLPVQLDVSGLPPSLPTPVELAAYRVVQESLTNALRYAQSPTRVRLSWIASGLDVLIENVAPGADAAPVLDCLVDARTTAAALAAPAAAVTVAVPPTAATATTADGVSASAESQDRDAERHSPPYSGGRGLAGLAERAEILSGTFDAGPRPGGGFAVHAWLPVHA